MKNNMNFEGSTTSIENINKPSKVEQLPEVVRMSSFDITKSNAGDFITLPSDDLKKAVGERRIKYVFQRGIGFVDGHDADTRYIETSDFGGNTPSFGSCVSVIARNPETKITGLLHADTITDIEQAISLIKEQVGTDGTQLSIIGGQDGASEGILRKVKEQIDATEGWEVLNIDILGPKNVMTRQVVIDAFNGDIYNLAGVNLKYWNIDLPDEIEMRARQTNLIENKLIIDGDLLQKDKVEIESKPQII